MALGSIGLLGLLGVGCGSAPDAASATESVIYGTDDRQDVYAVSNADLRELTASSIVALFESTAIDDTDPDDVVTLGVSLMEDKDLCPGESFEDDPAHASCSGTLIDDDLVLTAGHCFPGETAEERRAACQTQRFVFGYYRDSATEMHPITSDDVFDCDDVLAWALREEGDRNLDYAIVRLDRSAAPRFTPVVVRRPVVAQSVGASLVVIGFGSGIPAKIDTGGTVTDGRETTFDYFVADTDTFAGNSGSGVFDPTSLELIGILVRGATDYVLEGECYVAHVCSAIDPEDPDCAGESVSYPNDALTELCDGAGSARLCDAPDTDSGVVDTDAGVEVDGGATDPDAGIAADTGVAADAGTTPPSSGCACAAAARRTSGVGVFSLVALIGAVLGFRRRR